MISDTAKYRMKALGEIAVLVIMAFWIMALLSTAGCADAKEVQEIPTVAATPTPELTPAPIPEPTPAPAPTLTKRQAVGKMGGFIEGDTFSWHRENVSGLKDLTVRTTIYGHRFMNSFEEHSISWGTDAWFKHSPEPGMKFLFVFVNMFMDGNTTESDPRMWGITADHFAVQINGTLYRHISGTVDAVEPIKELSNVWDMNHTREITQYGYGDISYVGNLGKTKSSSTVNTVTTASGSSACVNSVSSGPSYMTGKVGKATRDELSWLRMGISNAWDGWILFEVPENTREDDVYVLASFNNLGGNVFWTLEVEQPAVYQRMIRPMANRDSVA